MKSRKFLQDKTNSTTSRGNLSSYLYRLSSINYKPYGEIHRTDSGGPDISKFKYTGQEEDKESGLMYYKARYYDPALGRFLQADSVVMAEATYGLNRYMYTFGNPIKFGDKGGNKPTVQQTAMILAYHLAEQSGDTANFGRERAVAMAGWGFKNKKWDQPFGNFKGSQSNRDGKQLRRDIGNTFSWITKSSGLKAAADTFNKMTGQDYNKRSRVGYGHCAGAAAFGPAAPPVFGLCMSMTAFYQLGARGGSFGGGDEVGFGLDVAAGNEDAPLINKVFGTIGTKFATGIGMYSFFAAAAYGAGSSIYDREMKHRRQILDFQCLYVSINVSFNISRATPIQNRDDNFLAGTLTNFGSLYSSCQTWTGVK